MSRTARSASHDVLARQATSSVVHYYLAGLLAGLGIDPGAANEQDAGVGPEQQALAHSTVPSVDVPGRGADLLPTGPGLAAWLAAADAGRCADSDLPVVAAAYRRLAAWAQAGELAAVAEVAARTAVRSDRADDTGQPIQLQPEAAAEVALALTMSQPTAADWTGLATRLRWQLPATATALAAGSIDLARARLISEATAPLPTETATAVEARVLPTAGEQTTGQLRAALRRAVIAADPDGADRRREHAERHARVSLYADQDGTATLTGSGLPAARAAAAMARITALARAMKSAGTPGGLDHLRAYVMLGLLLGTLPLIPPAPGAPPDDPPPDDSLGPSSPPDAPVRPDSRSDPVSPDAPDTPVHPAPRRDDSVVPDDPAAQDPFPPPVEPPDPGDPEPPEPDADAFGSDDDRDDPVDADRAPVTWPLLPAGLPSAAMSTTYNRASGRPPPGLLDVLLPWSAFTCASTEPAILGRIGPVTPLQAWQLLDLATRHPGTQWRVILTDGDGHAQAVERLRASWFAAPGEARAGPMRTAPTIGRVTVTIPEDAISSEPNGRANLDGLQGALLRAASRAAAAARAVRLADQAVGGCAHSARCAHSAGTATYRPSPRLREFVAARDLTCTFPTCGQPAWRADLDHTVPWHRGGPTCRCNLGGRCRTHHKIKQLPGWKLEQTVTGSFRWTTPAGRAYTVGPYRYPR